MAWSTAVTDVRKILSDGATDKLCYRKKVIGEINGTNVTFKTFEIRRISSLVTPTGPTGAFTDSGVAVPVTSEDMESGEFVVTTAPADGTSLVASYYYQWFNDDELTEFLTDASEWIGNGADFTTLGEDLRPSAKEYAAHKAYQKLISRMSVNLAETYQLYDAPDQKRFDPVAAYMKISQGKYDLALKLRNDVYTGRKGQAGAPRSGTVIGRVPNVAPNR